MMANETGGTVNFPAKASFKDAALKSIGSVVDALASSEKDTDAIALIGAAACEILIRDVNANTQDTLKELKDLWLHTPTKITKEKIFARVRELRQRKE